MIFVCTCDGAGNEHLKRSPEHENGLPIRVKTVTVSVPVMINHRKIEADTELILNWFVQSKPDKDHKKTKSTSWVDEVGGAEKRRRLTIMSQVR